MTREEIEKIASAFAIDEVKDTCNPASKRGLLYDGFVAGAEWADAHPHWTNVEDDGNPIDTGWYIFTTGKIVDVGYYLGGDEWRDVHPTHWMPLPQAPVLSNLEKTGKEGEQKYKEALKWMQGLYSGLHGATKEEAEHYFPELKESEDERIRKALIDYFKKHYEGSTIGYGVQVKEAIAWLEKQKGGEG